MSPWPIRYRGGWKIHKRSSEPDRWLDEMGYFRKHTARDSSCLFRAISENIYNSQRCFHKVRLDCVKFMSSKRHLFEGFISCPFETYLNEMSNPSEWGGFVEISAMSHLYGRDFVIFDISMGPQTKIFNGYGNPILLFYTPDTKHFDSVFTKDYITSSSFCQSLVYEVLYDGVFQLKDLSYAVDKMLHDKMTSNHIEYFITENTERRKRLQRTKIFIEKSKGDPEKDGNNNAVALKCKHRTEDMERASLLKESLSILVFNRSLIRLENVCLLCLNVNSAKDLLDNGITPFPYKVAKALDPEIYRNIEFDVWNELRREIRYGARYSDGTTLQVGVKCLCKLQPDQTVPYHCHIQEMRPEFGPCLVFIEELGEKRLVNYDQLEQLPLDQIRPWAPPYRFSRAHSQFSTISQMLQQLGNMTRRQGSGKSRNKTKSPIEDLSKTVDKVTDEQINESISPKLQWNESYDCDDMKANANEDTDLMMHYNPYITPGINFTAYHHLDFVNFEPVPIEITALPLMVDCHTVPGALPPAPATLPAAASDLPPQPHNGPISDNQSSSSDMGSHGVTSPVSARASTPASCNNLTTYAGGLSGYSMGMGVAGGMSACPAPPYAIYGGVKGGVVWCAPPHPPPTHHPPPGVNPHVFKSVHANGSDLPMNDIPTLRYYFNLGVDCMWGGYGPPTMPPPPPHHVPPPRHYSPIDLSQDMQQMTMHDRSAMPNHNGPEQNHKNNHKGLNQQGMVQDKNMNSQGKGNGQRPLLGPRFKRGGNNQDGNQGSNQNKGHNNNMGNKGPNSRRNSHTDNRQGPHNNYGQMMNSGGIGPEGECGVMEPLMTVPYLPYPPPLYPIPYYPVESDPGMMGMIPTMGGYMGGYESVGEAYAPPLPPYYPPPYPPPIQHQSPQIGHAPHTQHAPHSEHK